MGDWIANAESGSSVRGKLNTTQTDDGTATSGTKTLDTQASIKHKLTNGGDFTLAFSNWPASGVYREVEIQLINGGAHVITWPTINWLKGDGTVSTTFSTMGVTLYSSGTNTVVIWTTDGGTTLYGRAA
jgi:hypothetical protein